MFLSHIIYFYAARSGGLPFKMSVIAWTGHKIYESKIIQIVNYAWKHSNS